MGSGRSHAPERVRCGLDVLLADDARLDSLRGRRVGLLAHAASVTRNFEHAIDALRGADVPLVRLFGPEHGLRGEAQDMIAVDAGVDPLSGLETVSLYGSSFDSLEPPPGSLDDLDVLLIDLQDVGSRYYTYVYTAWFVARACARAGVEAWVLDRPNPLGRAVEGPSVEDGFTSFVGMLPLPNRHGLSVAEVLRFAAQDEPFTFRVVSTSVDVSERWFDEHDAPWVMPSPNMPTLDTALVYPGLCLLEGTNLSEGRGTTRPFELFGAPYVDASALRERLRSLELPGVRFRLASFEPTFQKWARTGCRGLQLHVTDRDAFLPFQTGAAIVWACRQLFDGFEWRRDAYEFVDDIPAIDLLFGSARPRTLIDEGASFEALSAVLVTPEGTRERVRAARLEARS